MALTNVSAWKLTDEQRAVVEGWLAEFKQSWDDGRLEARAGELKAGPLRLPALAEFVEIDLDNQWRRGRQTLLETYLQRFPELGTPETVSVDLIRAEYEARRRAGAPAALADFARRFPGQADRLRYLVEKTKDSYGTLEVPVLSAPEPPRTVRGGSSDPYGTVEIPTWAPTPEPKLTKAPPPSQAE
jgi:hypothetical protein